MKGVGACSTTTMNNLEIKKLDNAEVEISGEISADVFEQSRKQTVKNLSKDLSLPGFRKGHVPEDVAMKHVGEASVLNAMAERTLQKAYPALLNENKIDAIGQPEITITKIAAGNPLGFKIKVATMPEITLPDYKSIAKKVFSKKDEVSVEEKEVEETIAEIRKRHVAMKKAQAGAGAEKDSKDEEELPELNDAFVKTLGDFKDVADLKAKIKENILKEKQGRAKDKKRMETIEQIIAGGKMELPNILIEGELDRMTAQFRGNVEQSGGTLEDYLKYTKKTIEELRKEWRSDAIKRAKTQLILNKIALEEKVSAPKEKVEKEVEQLMKHYPDADPMRSRGYVEMILTNDAVFVFLEKQGA